MTDKELFIRSAQVDWSKIPENSYLRKIPALQDLSEISFHKPIAFFVGENGTGKSTLSSLFFRRDLKLCSHAWLPDTSRKDVERTSITLIILKAKTYYNYRSANYFVMAPYINDYVVYFFDKQMFKALSKSLTFTRI